MFHGFSFVSERDHFHKTVYSLPPLLTIGPSFLPEKSNIDKNDRECPTHPAPPPIRKIQNKFYHIFFSHRDREERSTEKITPQTV